ncbi:hypothetical protein RUMOBE_02006 [Blautia obeum ATCC 29174]|uniref:Uncharacterized protein n=1 Tax=Blautia obeum ATCC 29174 TaxID=411459 RepID=A5ZSM9_9FIRM|nr:hypothetical protein RUMOBE_02006 [Blautia obeum ATCC 29174]
MADFFHGMYDTVGMYDFETDFIVVTVIAIQVFLELLFCIIVIHRYSSLYVFISVYKNIKCLTRFDKK